MSARAVRTGIARAAAISALLALASSVHARPNYFDTFTAHYGIGPADNLHACGVCHYNWEGTGARNPFGQEVEQQLYIGKTITQSLVDIEAIDSDLDGFANGDEITIHMTLPGYSCGNFQDALDAPLGYDTFITPLVASCLEPLDIRVTPLTAGFVTKVDDSDTVTVTVYNNGTDFALDIDSYGLVTAGNPDLSLVGPAAPLSIPVGASITIDVVFAPTAPAFVNDTLRIESSDPDEDPVDVPISGFATQQVLASPEKREACLKNVLKAYRKYAKTHLRAWNRCYSDEFGGIACDAGVRELKVTKAAAKLRKGIGGAKDKLCAGENLAPSLLGLPATCGGDCNEIALGSMSQYADCLVCREETARDEELDLALGVVPPDLPTSLAGSDQSAECQENLLAATQIGIDHTLRALGNCEIANITTLTPVDCPTVLAEDLTAIQARVDAATDACEDTSGLEGCPFEPMPDPSCLGTGATGIGSALTDAVFDTD